MPSVRLTLQTNFVKASQDIKKGIRLSSQELEKLQKSVKKIDVAKFGQFIAQTKRLGAAVKATRGPLQGLLVQQRALARKIEQSVKHGLDPMSSELAILRRRYVAVTAAVERYRRSEKEAAKATRDAERAIREQEMAIKNMQDTAARWARYGLIAVAAGTALLGRSFIEAAAGIEDAEAAFRPMLGSLAKAKDMVALINETAATTPFQFEDIALSAKQLLPAVEGSAKGAIKIFRMLGDVSSGSAQRLDSVTRAFTKSMLRGQVDMRAMNMIARAGVPIFSELAKTMGVTVEELMKLSRLGKISSKDLVQAFENMTSAGGMFYRGMEIASRTLHGRISTLKDNLMLLAANLGNVLLPYAKAFVEVSLSAAYNLRMWTKDILRARAVLTGLAAAIETLTVGLVGIIALAKGAAIVQGLATAFQALKLAIVTNPITAFATALAAAVPTIIWLGQNWFLVSNKIMAQVELMRAAFQVSFIQIGRYALLTWNRVKTSFETFLYSISDKADKVFQAIYGKMANTGALGAKLQAMAAVQQAAVVQHRVNTKKMHKLTMDRLAAEKKALEDTVKDEQRILDDAAKKYQSRLKRIRAATLSPLARKAGEAGLPIQGDSLMKILSKSIDDSQERLFRKQINTFKAYYAERIEIMRIGEEQQVEFLRKELARVQHIEKLSADERKAAAMAAEDMITEIVRRQSKARTAIHRNEQKENDRLWREMLAANRRAWKNMGSGVRRMTDHLSFGMKNIGIFVRHTADMFAQAAETGKVAFSDMARSILRDLMRVMLNKNLTRFFTALFGGRRTNLAVTEQKKVVTQMAGATLGPLFGGGIIPAFATGGIVQRPTLAQVGESGPEAVVPLVRRNGVLGLAAPAAASPVTVNIINNTPSKISAQESTGPGGERILRILVDEQVTQAMDNGVYDAALRRNYGLTRKPYGR